MTNRSFTELFTVMAAMLVMSLAAFGQDSGGEWAVSRTADGRPDLGGVWNFGTTTPLERPDELAGKEFLTDEEVAERDTRLAQGRPGNDLPPREGDTGTYNNFWWERGHTVDTKRTSLLVDPPNGKLPPLTPEAQERAVSSEADRIAGARRGRLPAYSWIDLDAGDRCIQHRKAGPPISPSGYNNHVQVFQTRDHVAIVNEQIHDVRIVSLDGRAHIGPDVRQWMGDSRGHWEGDTLVVETTNFNGRHDQVGRPLLNSGERSSVIERFTRVDADTLLYESTVTDRATWVADWTQRVPMKKSQDRMYEYACHERNYSIVGMLAGSRAQEKNGETR